MGAFSANISALDTAASTLESIAADFVADESLPSATGGHDGVDRAIREFNSRMTATWTAQKANLVDVADRMKRTAKLYSDAEDEEG